ncbi:ABC transporter ATP-binding protein [Cohnella sp. JJ-181]|uniref:ABC transporter ATP-binding protein n=1 Tax=Cohnella rhizoplanae TaxID=2974897 RepID=UPI0022FF980E|nr:ABC transporter ATP-binding protein [Cohnella sp. JJ-181]CAI6082481.1 putative ABC transporter ATP-binding protein YknY [Cohnella sp. JJ-181]
MSKTAPSPLIAMEDVFKKYTLAGETLNALDGISLTVNKGDFMAIVGPSGSGKSTLMNVLGCLDTPTGGKYTLDGAEVGKLSDNKLAHIRNNKIGFIFQSFHLLPRLRAIENVELPLVYRGMSGRERRALAKEALEKVGLGDRMHHMPNQLSGGQQQRVAIARALAGRPPLLLADEPTGALDSKTSRDVIGLLQELNAEGNTIVLITHDPKVAEQARRVVRIQDGMLTEERSAAS